MSSRAEILLIAADLLKEHGDKARNVIDCHIHEAEDAKQREYWAKVRKAVGALR